MADSNHLVWSCVDSLPAPGCPGCLELSHLAALRGHSVDRHTDRQTGRQQHPAQGWHSSPELMAELSAIPSCSPICVLYQWKQAVSWHWEPSPQCHPRRAALRVWGAQSCARAGKARAAWHQKEQQSQSSAPQMCSFPACPTSHEKFWRLFLRFVT